MIPCLVHPDAPTTYQSQLGTPEGLLKLLKDTTKVRSKQHLFLNGFQAHFEALAVRAVDLPMPFVPTSPNTCPVKPSLTQELYFRELLRVVSEDDGA